MNRPDPDYLDLIQKWKELGQLAINFQPVKLPMNCEGHDFRAIVKDLEQLVTKVDAVVLAYGDYINSNSSGNVDLSYFDNPLADALEGFAYYEIESVAERADEEMFELQAAE